MTLHIILQSILFLSFLFYSYAQNDSFNFRVVQTSQGPVRGFLDPDGEIFEFYGTSPPDNWVDIYDATDNKIVCPQLDVLGKRLGNFIIKEDCLIANVFVPNTPDKPEKLPVLVVIHGGAYFIGYGNMNSWKNLMKTEHMIVVTFNYRLGPHGFLCLGTEDVPGNAGMKDQVALLRWVQKNIPAFGGNSDDVTIYGFSAGASAVDLMIVSNITHGLFKKVILDSGANTAAFSVQSDPIQIAKEYAQLLNFTNVDDFKALEEFYKTASYNTLNSVRVLSRPDSTFLLSPCVERDLGQEIFLADNPVNILKSGNYQKLPMLFGFANMEGLFRIPVFINWKNEMNENFSEFLPADLRFDNNQERQDVTKSVKYFYFGNETVSDKTVLKYVDYFTDVIFAYSILRSIRLQVEAGNDKIYLYEYAFVDEDTPFVPYTNVRGADHCAQTEAVADGMNLIFTNESALSDEHREMKRVIRKLWANFITTGMPVVNETDLPSWPAVGEDCSPHMSLNIPLELKGPLLKERRLFWEDIYNKHYFEPKSPPVPGKATIMSHNIIILYICLVYAIIIPSIL